MIHVVKVKVLVDPLSSLIDAVPFQVKIEIWVNNQAVHCGARKEFAFELTNADHSKDDKV